MRTKLTTVLSLVLVSSISARTYRIPEDEPVARIAVPNGWKTAQHEEFLESTPRNGTCHLLVLAVEGRKPAETMLEAMRYIRRNGTVKVDAQSEKREEMKIGATPIRTFTWDATEKNQPIRIRCHLFSELNGKRLLVVFWSPLEGEKKYQRDLNQILESVQVP